MRIGSLFAGVGGFDLAAEWIGWETAWFSEVDDYASQVLARRWPGIPNHGDITKIKGGEVEPVNMLCGGFPCQDISLAGKGAGIQGRRSGLWSHYARLISELQPSFAVIENVPVLRRRGLDVVLRDLFEIGYDAEWHCIPAGAVGAPHQRDRIWIIAYPDSYGTRLEGRQGVVVQERAGQRVAGEVGPQMADPDTKRIGTPDSSGWGLEPDVGRVADGVPARVDRLRCLGNAIVPQVAYAIFQHIAACQQE